MILFLICVATSGAAYSQAKGGPTPSPPGAAVYFVDLKDGATLPPKATIHFGLRGMGVAPAGSDRQNSGHHHLLVDAELPPLNVQSPMISITCILAPARPKPRSRSPRARTPCNSSSAIRTMSRIRPH